MANGNGNGKGTNWGEPLLWALLALILFRILVGLPGAIEERLGVDASPIAFFEKTEPLTVASPVGTKIVSKRETSMRSEPGGAEIFLIAKGSRGIVIGGPVLQNDVLWWEVVYGDGSTGWVPESQVAIDAPEDRKTLNNGTPSGSKTINSKDTNVRSAPGGGNVLSKKLEGDRGTVVLGPEIVFGERWWKIRYEDGITGWVREDDLEIDIGRDIRAVTSTTEIGAEIRSISRDSVFNRPNGDVLRALREGERGSLAGGPALIGERRWWSVDFRENSSGWVREEVITRHFSFTENVLSLTAFYKPIAYTYSILLFVALIYIILRLRGVIAAERDKFRPISGIPHEVDRDTSRPKNVRWEQVLSHIESENPNDWRLAILEADILLDEMVTSFGYEGDTLGEKLQNIERSDFLTLNEAWEAHKVRNEVAHTGSAFVLTQREARRIIGLYERVFKEFYLI